MTFDKDSSSRLAQSCQELVQAMRKLAQAYLYEARFDEALGLLDSDVVRQIEAELTPVDQVRIQVQRASMLRYKGLTDNDHDCYDATLEILLEAEEAARGLDDKGLLADVVDLIGMTLYSKELWLTTLDEPLRYFEEGLRLRKEIGDRRGVAESVFHVGLVYQNKEEADDQDSQKAFECFQESYRLAEQGAFMREKAHTARHLAYMHRRKGETDKVLTYHKEFLAVNAEIGFKPYLPTAYFMVGEVYLTNDELDQAMACFQKARVVAEETSAGRYLAEALFGIGAVNEKQGKKQAALDAYQDALTLAEQTNFKRVADLARIKIENLSEPSKR
jgi:tetratricopeptide (TPR) repeat protein